MEPRVTLVTLGVRDLAHARRFYCDGLGWPASSASVDGEVVFLRTGDVDVALAQAVAAGATLVKPAVDAPWGGYSGYFADPDGHLWEVAWSPGFPLDAAGQPQLPE